MWNWCHLEDFGGWRRGLYFTLQLFFVIEAVYLCLSCFDFLFYPRTFSWWTYYSPFWSLIVPIVPCWLATLARYICRINWSFSFHVIFFYVAYLIILIPSTWCCFLYHLQVVVCLMIRKTVSLMNYVQASKKLHSYSSVLYCLFYYSLMEKE